MSDPRRQARGIRTRMRVLAIAAAVLLTSCTDRGPVGAEAPVKGESEPALAGIPSLVIREQSSELSGIWAPVLRAVRGVNGKPLQILVTRSVEETTSKLTFEGGENDTFLKDRVAGFASGFSEWLTLVDKEAGGSGNFANEQSPSTVAFWDFKDEECLKLAPPADAWPGGLPSDWSPKLSRAPCASFRDLHFESPVRKISLHYTSYVHVALSAFDASGNLVATVTGLPNYGAGTNPPDDEGPYNLFSRLEVSAPDDGIAWVRVNGYIQASGFDDLTITRSNLAPDVSTGGPYSVDEGSSVTLGGSDSEDPEDGKTGLSFSWNVNGTTTSGAEATAGFEDDRTGGYPATLTVTDQNGKSASATTQVSVLNVAPELEVMAPIQLAGQQLSASIGFTDPGADSWTATIDYDVNSTSDAIQTVSLSGRTVPLGHTYPSSGTYTISVRVDDGDGGVDTKTVSVVAANLPPVVTASAAATTVGCVAGVGTVALIGTAIDPDGNPLDVGWYEGATRLSTDLSPRLALPLGTHVLQLRATERGEGGLSSSATVTVAVVDMSVPSVKLSATPGTIWTPNHKYVSVAVSARAEDTCTAGASTSTMVGYVESNEPDDVRGSGDGDTSGDIRVVHVHDGNAEELSSNSHRQVSFHPGDQLQVRAERGGASEGRIYTIHFTATDGGGTGTATGTIRVDHDRAGR